MLRDFIMAMLMLALATIPVASWFGGPPKLSVETVEATLAK